MPAVVAHHGKTLTLPIALLAWVASYLDQREHAAFRRVSRLLHGAAAQVGAGPFHIFVEVPACGWHWHRTYMRPSSVTCRVSAGANGDMMCFVASVAPSLARLCVTFLHAVPDAVCVPTGDRLCVLSLAETHDGETSVFRAFLDVGHPRLHTLRLSSHCKRNFALMLDDRAARRLPMLQTLSVAIAGPFLFCGAWPRLETLGHTQDRGLNRDAIDVAQCPRLVVIDESNGFTVNLCVYGALFVQNYRQAREIERSPPKAPCTKTLRVGARVRHIKLLTQWDGVDDLVESTYSLDHFRGQRAGADFSWKVVTV